MYAKILQAVKNPLMPVDYENDLKWTGTNVSRSQGCNGMRLVWIKTLHGKFVFGLQKYHFHAQETNYFELTNQLQEGYVSSRLQELCGYYSNRISYEEVAKLVERVSGKRLLSDQKIGQIVSAKALKISQEIYKNTRANLAKIDSNVV
jgi:hypothetical protein